MIGTGGVRRASTFGALIGMLTIAACGQSPPPPAPAAKAPPAAQPAPASQPAAAATGTQPPRPNVERIADGTDALTHGRYLVETIAGCGNCHTPHLPDGSLDPDKAFSGAFVIKEPVFEAYARNITPDMETGIGSWSEDDIVNALIDPRVRY